MLPAFAILTGFGILNIQSTPAALVILFVTDPLLKYYRVLWMLRDLQEPLRRKGYSIQLVQPRNGLFRRLLTVLDGDFWVDLTCTSNVRDMEEPVALPHEVCAPYTSKILQEAWYWPHLRSTGQCMWTLGGVLHSLERAQESAGLRTTNGDARFPAAAAVLAIFRLTSPFLSEASEDYVMYALIVALLVSLYPVQRQYGCQFRIWHARQEQALNEFNPKLYKHCGYTASLKIKGSWFPYTTVILKKSD